MPQLESVHDAPARSLTLAPRVRISVLGKSELHEGLQSRFSLSNAHRSSKQPLPAELQQEIRNRELELLCKKTGIRRSQLVYLKQVHGERSICPESLAHGFEPPCEADALFTARPARALVVRTADCLPVFFAFSGPGLVAGVIHSGWRGTAQGIVPKTLMQAWRYAQNLGKKNRHEGDSKDFPVPASSVGWTLHWAIGPAIGRDNYEVQEDVAAFFKHIQPGEQDGRYLLDLSREVQDQVADFCNEQGLQEDYKSDLEACTIAENDLYYSHRAGDPYRNLNMIEIIAKDSNV